MHNLPALIKACIFDLDGVIVDTARYHYLAWKRLADELNISFEERDNERLKGVSRMASLNILLELGGRQASDEEKTKLAARKNLWFVDFINHMNRSEIFVGVEDLLRDIRLQGILVGLASSSKNAPQVVKALGIAALFDAIVDGSMVTRTKPDPEIFLLAASLLNVPPVNCVVIEDAAAGIEAAKAAGMKCIGVGSREQLSAADLVVEKTGEITSSVLARW